MNTIFPAAAAAVILGVLGALMFIATGSPVAFPLLLAAVLLPVAAVIRQLGREQRGSVDEQQLAEKLDRDAALVTQLDDAGYLRVGVALFAIVLGITAQLIASVVLR